MSGFHVVPIFGLTALFESADVFDEVNEAVKFLGYIVHEILKPESAVDLETTFFAYVRLYTPGSSLAQALTLFGHTHLTSLEAAVRSFSAGVARNELSLSHNNPVLLQIKDWLIRCACAPQVDPSGILANKLDDYFLDLQPQLADLVPPLPFVIGGLMPELSRALTQLEDTALSYGVDLGAIFREGHDGYFHPVRYDAFHIVREFMRLAMNCGAVLNKYAPRGWNLANGPPQLSEEALFAGHMVVSEAWRRMLTNPFSDAPLHVRCLLARCNIIDAAGFFFLPRHTVPPYPNLLSNEQKWPDCFVQMVQWAAEDADSRTFRQFREVRLPNPFLGTYISPASFARPLGELDVMRQPWGESYMVSGIPTSDVFHLPEEAEIELPANFQRQEYLMEFFYDPILTAVEDESDDEQHIGQQQLLEEDVPVYSGQLAPAAPPRLVAVGPLIRAGHHSDPVNEADLREGDQCLICQYVFLEDVSATNPCVRLRACGHLIHLEELEQQLNGAYFDQPSVRCGLCRAHICASRQTVEVVD